MDFLIRLEIKMNIIKRILFQLRIKILKFQ